MTLEELEKLEKMASPEPWDGQTMGFESFSDEKIASTSRNILPEVIALVRAARKVTGALSEFELIRRNSYIHSDIANAMDDFQRKLGEQ